ncbi:MAG: Zn-ribbon domain-containing OB-fold protein [Actinomycetota bacterium]|nr:Zn-ribbon domain-containing OB-fold protein [Actinomycetota bacterium]
MMTTTSAEMSQAGMPFVPGVLEVGPDGKGHLVGAHCPGCGASYFPARSVCSRCLRGDLERVPLGSSGTLYTYTVIHQSLPQFETPYILGYVDLDDNVRVAGQLVDVEADAVELGMRLTLQVEPLASQTLASQPLQSGEVGEGKQVLWFRFRPEAAASGPPVPPTGKEQP